MAAARHRVAGVLRAAVAVAAGIGGVAARTRRGHAAIDRALVAIVAVDGRPDLAGPGVAGLGAVAGVAVVAVGVVHAGRSGDAEAPGVDAPAVEAGIVGLLTVIYGVDQTNAVAITLVDRAISVMSIWITGGLIYALSRKTKATVIRRSADGAPAPGG